MSWSTDDGGEDGSWSVISGETSLAHTLKLLSDQLFCKEFDFMAHICLNYHFCLFEKILTKSRARLLEKKEPPMTFNLFIDLL